MNHIEEGALYKCNTCGTTYQIPISAQSCCINFSVVSEYRCPICRCSYHTPTEAYECRIRCTDALLDEALQWIARSCPLTKNCASNIGCFAQTCQHMDKEKAFKMVKACVERSKNHD